MSEKHGASKERSLPSDTILRIGEWVTKGVARIVDIFFPPGKGS